MLPVGIRKASITNARKTNARMKAVISHSKVLAISVARSFFFTEGRFFSTLAALFSGIDSNPIRN